MGKIIQAYMLGEGIQIHEEIAPGEIKVEFFEPEDDGFLAALELVGESLPPATEYTDHESLLISARQHSTIPDDLFAIRLGPAETGGTGILSEDEAVELSAGNLPARTITALSPQDRMLAKMEAKKPELARLGPVALAIQNAYELTEEQMDAIFNVDEE